jgi:acetyl-CoA carboxylase biotin carboxylase subunit
VTEAITGLDLVAEQIALAEGKKLRLKQSDISFSGHAIECRINAEDCSRDFLPSPGTVTRAQFPAGPAVRVDTHIETGSKVTPYYDSLLGKIIVHAEDRPAALAAMRIALSNCRIDGVATNLSIQRQLLTDAEFIQGGVDTAYFSRFVGAPGGQHV